MLAPGYRGTEAAPPTLTTMTTGWRGVCGQSSTEKKFQNVPRKPGHKLQTVLEVPDTSALQELGQGWGLGSSLGLGAGPCQFCCEGCMPCGGCQSSKQAGVVSAAVPFQSAEGNMATLRRERLPILPKLGRTFQGRGRPGSAHRRFGPVRGRAGIGPGASGASCATPLTRFGGLPGATVLPRVCRWAMGAGLVWPTGCSYWELRLGLHPTLFPNSGRDELTSARNWGGLLCLPGL